MKNSMIIELEMDRIAMSSPYSYQDVADRVIGILRKCNYNDLFLIEQMIKEKNKIENEKAKVELENHATNSLQELMEDK